MEKVYVLSERSDEELEQVIHNMAAYRLRIVLYGIARGWKFDEAIAIAEVANRVNACPSCEGTGLAFTLGQVGTCNTCRGSRVIQLPE